MDIRKVKKLIELMEESDITEIEIKEGEESVRISRNNMLQGPQNIPAEAGSTVSDQVDGRRASAGNRQTAPKMKGKLIHAPMVGTFYAAPSPGSPPFVEIGNSVKVGDTLCIIESMKMMNQVKSEMSGVIEAVLVGNEDTVEFDQPLFTIS